MPAAAPPASATALFDPRRVDHAIAGCMGCPLLAECSAAGAYERHGVWGGVNRDPTAHAVRPRRDVPARRPRPPRRHRRPGPAFPVACPYCGVGPGVICVTGDGTQAETSHDGRKRAAEARSDAA